MGSAHALPVPFRLSLRLSVREILDGLGFRTVVAASVLAILAIAGAATALLFPQSSTQSHTAVTPVSTAAASR